MKKILLLLLLTLPLFTRADFSIDWTKVPDLAANLGTYLVVDSSNNVYTTTLDNDIVLEKRDRFGNFIWRATSVSQIPLNYEYPSKVFLDPQSNPVVIGFRYQHSSSGRISNSLIILKYDQNGNLIYKKNIDGNYSPHNNSTYWTKLTGQMDADGYLYLATGGNVDNNPIGMNIIKIDPAGNIVRISTNTFPSSTNFHFISNIFLNHDKVGVTGVTSYSSANSTSWLMDTSGVTLWDSINVGVQGKDLFIDTVGNSYILSWEAVIPVADVLLYKYDVAGNLLWTRQYDLGGYDISSKLRTTSDGKLIIMAYSTTTGGSNYVDWQTVKVDTSGNILWQDRYNEHSGNDEIPYDLATDNRGNTFVTGIGGPFPGGSTLSARQMVTVKYDSTGAREWVNAIDTINEYLSGVSIAKGFDSSLFVLGDVNTFIVHYLDHTGSDPCSVPTGINAINITGNSSTITWNAIPNAYLYHVQYRIDSSLIWQTYSTNQTQLQIYPLYSGTVYEYRVEAICNSGPTGYSSVQQFTTTGSGYCASSGVDATNDFIDLVYIGTMLNSTVSDSGYGDYTSMIINMTSGSTYNITLSAEILGSGATEFWKVWIDFNQNGSFADPGEEVVSYSSQQIGWETSIINVPITALTGQTKMRVSMKNGSAQTSCEVFAAGEVEDYGVSMNTITSIDENSSVSSSIYPNPVTTVLKADMKSGSVNTVRIVSLTGSIVNEFHFVSGTFVMDVNDLVAGIYFMEVTNENGVKAIEKFVLAK
ncbi:MAG: T9SS type A sorting domain-containing protein [Bacteroidia bacterium]|nr:T9SS type A sorting domain-containing protein [Bacteroidia bacterium]